jgi:hypothetical protein
MMADQASQHMQHLEHYPGVSRYTYTAKEILTDLLSPGQWYVGDREGTPMVTPSITAIQHHIHSNYLQRRDIYRQQDEQHPRPPFWTATSTTMAARQFACRAKRSYAQQTRITKIIYDHYMHGENRVKGILDQAQRKELSVCMLCGEEDSEQHSLLLCPGPALEDTSLEDRRTQAILDISEHIGKLQPGLRRSMAETYREFLTDNRHQPQRLWKGLLTPTQMSTLFAKHDVTPLTPPSIAIANTFKHIQHILACGVIDIRTQLTAFMYPHTRSPKSPLEPTPKQAAAIAARNAQPNITTFFKSSTSTQGSLSATTRHRLAHKTITTFTTYSRGSRTPRIHIVPPYIPLRPTNPVINNIRPPVDTSNNVEGASRFATNLANYKIRPATNLAPVHSKTMSLALYRHTDPLWGYQAPSPGPPSVIDDGGLDGD